MRFPAKRERWKEYNQTKWEKLSDGRDDGVPVRFNWTRGWKGAKQKKEMRWERKGKNYDSLAGIVVRMMKDEIGEDDLDALPPVTAELVIAVHGRRVGGRVAGRRERAVLLHVAAEQTITRRACRPKTHTHTKSCSRVERQSSKNKRRAIRHEYKSSTSILSNTNNHFIFYTASLDIVYTWLPHFFRWQSGPRFRFSTARNFLPQIDGYYFILI